MAQARLVLLTPENSARDIELYREASIGRAPDNSIPIDDQMVSQYHVLIERRGDAFLLIDLDSTNGTLVNGEAVRSDKVLENGDQIQVGEVTRIQFVYDGDLSQSQERIIDQAPDGSIEAPHGADPEVTQSIIARRPSPVLMIAAVIALIVGIAVGTVLYATNSLGGIDPEIRFLSPETGTTIRGAQPIRVEADGTRDIDEVIYLLDGIEFATAAHPPFEAALDPAQLNTRIRNLTSGNHVLTATIQQKNGKREPQQETIYLAFEMSAPVEDTVASRNDLTSGPSGGSIPNTPSADVASLSRNLAATISGKGWYEFDTQLVDEIRRRTLDYRIDVTSDASRYRRQIGNAFNSKGLPPAIGFILAISESRFKESPSSTEKFSFWQVPRQIALEQGYVLPEESLGAFSDAKRSAEVAAAYTNDLINTFGGTDNFMYAVACYGISLSQAAIVRTRLEEVDPDSSIRRDFWRVLRSGVLPREALDRVARFFAAGIVAENPKSFGLSSSPLSALY
ncbi:MAG TPA: FHA domain-containing protein [Blastocatellia bacterium]|nr:FHA domain-containing protein [Blastocatellia bacterium]